MRATSRAFALAATLFLLLSGCGDRNAARTPQSELAEAASATVQAPGASIAITYTRADREIPQMPRRVVIKVHGIDNARQHSMHLVGTYDKVPHIFLDGGSGTRVEIITALPHVYMKSHLFWLSLPRVRKEWIHLDLSKTGRYPAAGDWTRADPTRSLRALVTTGSHVRRVGSEQVRGVATTHYRAVTYLGPTEVWIDERHLVRRIRARVKTTVAGKPVAVDLTTELFDFGPKPEIKLPPAGDVYDASKASAGGP